MLGKLCRYLWTLATVGTVSAPQSSFTAPQDRINEAMPLPKSIEYARNELMLLAVDAGVRVEVESQFSAKLRVRAFPGTASARRTEGDLGLPVTGAVGKANSRLAALPSARLNALRGSARRCLLEPIYEPPPGNSGWGTRAIHRTHGDDKPLGRVFGDNFFQSAP